MIELKENICAELLNQSNFEFDECEYHHFDSLDKIIFSRKNGIIYQFYVKKGDKYELKYIGKSTGKGFRTRLRAHFLGIGKGTQSKHNKIAKEREIRNEVYFKFIETNPVFLRNLIEEMLIDHHKLELDLWNYKA